MTMQRGYIPTSGSAVVDIDDLVDGTTNHVFTAADDTKLAGIAAGATNTLSPAGELPEDSGFLAWNYDYVMSGGNTTPTAGVLNVVRLTFRSALTVTSLSIFAQTGGTSPTNCYLGLYDSGGTRRGLTANQASNWDSSGTKTAALTTPYSAAAGVYYVAILTGGGTPPGIARVGSVGQANAGQSSPSFRAGTVLTGQTSLPSSITLANVAASNNAYWVGVS